MMAMPIALKATAGVWKGGECVRLGVIMTRSEEPTAEIYALTLHDALPISVENVDRDQQYDGDADRAEGYGGCLEVAVMRALEGHHDHDRHGRPFELPHHEMPARSGPRVHGRHDGGGAVEDQHPEEHHHHHGDEQDPIGFESLTHISFSPATAGQSV